MASSLVTSKGEAARLRALGVDCDAADIGPGFAGFGHAYRQHAVLERCRRLVLLDTVKRYPPFEAAVISLAEAPVPVFGFRFLFAGDQQHAIRDFQADVLFLQARQFGRDANVRLRLVDVNVRPVEAFAGAEASERRQIKPAKDVVEQAGSRRRAVKMTRMTRTLAVPVGIGPEVRLTYQVLAITLG